MAPTFEWDPAKDAANQLRHGVSFGEAQLAFLDASRVIARDITHSRVEERFYCFGRVALGVLTVRFTYRMGEFELSALAFGVEEGRSMRRTAKYTDEALGRLEIIKDFLPSPRSARLEGGRG